MDRTINAKQLRASLSETVRRVRRGERFTVLYRGRPAFRIVPVEEGLVETTAPLAEDPIYRARAVGRSGDGRASRDHDRILYGAPRKRVTGSSAGGTKTSPSRTAPVSSS